MQKHGKPAVLRQAIPILFVLMLIILVIAGIIQPLSWLVLGGILSIYILGLLFGSVDVARQAGLKYAITAPIVFFIIHFGYGIGGLWGIIRFLLLRGAGMKKPTEMKMSR